MQIVIIDIIWRLHSTIGYYVPSMIAASCFMAIGSGLMTTFTLTTSSPHWVGYQFLVGFGIGTGLMAPSLATLPMEDVPTGVSITFFARQVGGAIFVSVGQTLLSTFLVSRLSNIPGLDAQAIVSAGATDLNSVVPAQFMDTVADAYNHACTRIFFAVLALSLAQLVCTVFVEWKSLKKSAQGSPSQSAPDLETKAEQTGNDIVRRRPVQRKCVFQSRLLY